MTAKVWAPPFCCAKNIMQVLEAGSIADRLPGVERLQTESRN